MNSDEINNLLSVMQKKITELTSQNIMLEAKIIYLNTVITTMNNKEVVSDGGEFSDNPSPSEQAQNSKSRRSA